MLSLIRLTPVRKLNANIEENMHSLYESVGHFLISILAIRFCSVYIHLFHQKNTSINLNYILHTHVFNIYLLEARVTIKLVISGFNNNNYN